MLRSAHRLAVAVIAVTWSVTTLMAQDALSVAPQSVTVLFENEQVRVLRESLLPGQQMPLHMHPARVSFALADSRLTLADSTGGTAVQEARAGDVTWGEPITHAVTNSGGASAEYIHFEIKVPPSREFSSISLMGGTANVLLDTTQVRVIDLRLAPKEKAISAQSANRVLFAFSPFRCMAEYDARTRNRIDADLHSVNFLPEGLDLIENNGKVELHALVIELK